ncbi:hypothetical protein [Parafrankia sp. EUN1f]|uniref:hypothetical protein n=1 Tax=Parafrankia sp. EUN1f TaxID=102897 RepID=UPI0001C44A22|nr:hypothetical protein [Parafrankia sp. EUN1f]EFC85045.1 hypothetical protein FrEUN1fDRAFT_1831 [Parafrankia sp. EUN1f]
MHGDDSLADLLGRLAVVEAQVRGAVAARRAVDPEPDDSFRGLYLSDSHIDALLLRTPTQAAPAPPGAPGPADPADPASGDQNAGSDDLAAEVERAAAVARERGSRLRLRELAGSCGLSGLDVDILLVALAPDLDARFEKFYGYLHDDVTRRRASPGLALELCGRSPIDGAARARCAPGAPLLATGLLVVEDADRPFLTRSLRVPDRVTAHLLGVDDPGPVLAEVLTDAPDVDDPVVRRVARFLSTPPRPPRLPDPRVLQARPAADARTSDNGLDEARPDGVEPVDPRLVYLRTTPGADGLAAALSACRRAGRRAIGLDLSAPGLARVADPAGGAAGSGDVGAGEGGETGTSGGSGSAAVPTADRLGGVAATLAVAVREARLAGAVLVAGPTGMLDPAARGLLVRAAAGGDGTLPPLPVVLYGRGRGIRRPPDRCR